MPGSGRVRHCGGKGAFGIVVVVVVVVVVVGGGGGGGGGEMR